MLLVVHDIAVVVVVVALFGADDESKLGEWVSEAASLETPGAVGVTSLAGDTYAC